MNANEKWMNSAGCWNGLLFGRMKLLHQCAIVVCICSIPGSSKSTLSEQKRDTNQKNNKYSSQTSPNMLREYFHLNLVPAHIARSVNYKCAILLCVQSTLFVWMKEKFSRGIP